MANLLAAQFRWQWRYTPHSIIYCLPCMSKEVVSINSLCVHFRSGSKEKMKLVHNLASHGGIATVAADSHANFLGYSAKYGVYSLLETKVNRINIQLVRVRVQYALISMNRNVLMVELLVALRCVAHCFKYFPFVMLLCKFMEKCDWAKFPCSPKLHCCFIVAPRCNHIDY